MVTRVVYRFHHWAFLGGGDYAAAYEELVEDYRDLYSSQNGSRRVAELATYRSMAESIDDDTKFVVRVILRTAYLLARVLD